MQLVVKFPTRSRPEKFLETLKTYISLADDISNILFIISCDKNDETMNNPKIKKEIKSLGINYKIYFGNNKTKIEAINADMENVEFDVLLLASDDMIPQVQGYDKIIINDMKSHFPDTDGVLWYFDGYQKALNTLVIMGKKYYGRFGFIYNPAYKSLWCDNEFTVISQKLGKCHFSKDVIIRHVHPSNDRSAQNDALYVRNESYNLEDRNTFMTRLKNGFGEKAESKVSYLPEIKPEAKDVAPTTPAPTTPKQTPSQFPIRTVYPKQLKFKNYKLYQG
jgi:hypothetical protein